jgi:hypothetical protein
MKTDRPAAFFAVYYVKLLSDLPFIFLGKVNFLGGECGLQYRVLVRGV